MYLLKNKVILITGANGKLGSTIAQTLLTQKPKLLLLHFHSKHPAIPESKVVKHIQTNINSEIQIANLRDAITKFTPHIDVIINTVGVKIQNEDPLEADLWKRTFQTNLFGIVETCRALISLIKKKGVIINISCFESENDSITDHNPSHAASKIALIRFTKSLALLYGPRIRAVSISPIKIFQKDKVTKNKSLVTSQDVTLLLLQILRDEKITKGNFVLKKSVHSK